MEDRMREVDKFVKQFNSFETATEEARAESERDRDYDDHHQWSDAEKQVLAKRNQPPVVINRIKTKVNLLTGIQTRSRTMPRALPRTPKHKDGADAVTECLRFIVDNSKFQMKSSAIFRSMIVSGYAGAIVETETKGNEEWVAVTKIPWENYYYDYHSRELDFSDKSWDGISKWLDKEDVVAMFPDKKTEIMDAMSSSTGSDTFDDKPTWFDARRERLRVNQHFYKENDVWYMCFFTDGFYLSEPAESPYLDEFDQPQNPIESQTAYIDRELQRYGEVRQYIWLQDEVNHRRSRLLYAGSVNRTMGEDGAVDDVNEMQRQMAKADGHVKINPGFSDKFQLIPNADISNTQVALLQEAKAEIDNIGANPALAGRGNTRSGRQDQIQIQAGQSELASIYDGHRDWEQRIYRQMWNRARKLWDAEKWIRVTDDKTDLEWVGLNIPVTKGQMLMEAAQNGSEEAAIVLQQMRPDDPRLAEVAEVQNNVQEMDVDIIMTEAPNTESLWQETFESLMELAKAYGPEAVPFSVALELSRLPNLKDVKALLNPPVDPEAAAQQQQIQELMFNLDVADKQSKIKATEAKAQRDLQDAEAQAIENEIVKDGYPNAVADRDAETVKKRLENIQKQVETINLANKPDENPQVNV